MSQYPNNPLPRSSSMLGYESNTDSMVMSQFFNAVYAWMAAGLALTAVVAWAVADSPTLHAMAMNGPMLILAFIVEIGLVISISSMINRISASTATVMFMLYAAVNGFSLSILLFIYAHVTLGAAFVATAGTFGAMSLYGYVTKRDLTRLGSLLFMGLIGVIIASLVNIFWANSILYWAVTYLGVLIFVGLTAYDTQQLKVMASQSAGNPALANRLAVVGSLRLYLDFINLFLLILRLMGNRRN